MVARIRENTKRGSCPRCTLISDLSIETFVFEPKADKTD